MHPPNCNKDDKHGMRSKAKSFIAVDKVLFHALHMEKGRYSFIKKNIKKKLSSQHYILDISGKNGQRTSEGFCESCKMPKLESQ